MAIDPIVTESYFKPIINATTGRVAFQVKGEDGATKTVEVGDSGIRDLSGLFITGTVASGRILAQRIGNTVTWYFINVTLQAGALPTGKIMEGPGTFSEFLPAFASHTAPAITNGAGESVRLLVSGTGITIQYAKAGPAYVGTVTYVTTKAWPTTLPGVANGQPVAV